MSTEVALTIYRFEGETWRDAVARQATKAGLEVECLEIFDYEISKGVEEPKAAFNSLYEWDCIDDVQNR